MQQLLVAWNMGQTPDTVKFASLDEEMMQDLYDMIVVWKRTERENDFLRLGMMLCGDPDEKKDKPSART